MLGVEAVLEGEPSIVALANGWVTISVAGGPTDDKPTVTLEPPSDPGHVSSFLNSRVANIRAIYEQWSARGAEFLTRRSSFRNVGWTSGGAVTTGALLLPAD